MLYGYEVEITVDGDPIGFIPSSLSLDDTGFGRKILTFATRTRFKGTDADPYRIAKKIPVILTLDSVEVFNGVSWSVKEQHAFENVGMMQTVTCVDYGKFTERTPMNEPAPSRSLHDAVEASLANMGGHGVSLDPTQIDPGPTVPDDLWPWMSVRKIHEKLTSQTGWVPKWTGPLVKFIAPGSTLAPFQINLIDPFWTTINKFSTLENYFNQVWLRFGPQGLTQVVEQHFGNGTTQDFPLRATLVLAGGGNATQSGLVAVSIDGAATTPQNIDIDPISGTAQWHFDVDTNTLIQDAGETPLSAASYVEIVFTAQFPQAEVAQNDAEVTANGLFTAIVDDTSIADATVAQARVLEILAQIGGEQQTVVVNTHRQGLEPFQSLTINVLDHVINGDYLILRTVMKHISLTPIGHVFNWEVNCLLGNESKQNWEQFWRELATASGGTGGTTLPPTVIPPAGLFPVRRSRTSGNSGGSNVTSHGINLPTYVEGDTLLVMFSVGGAVTTSVDTGVSSSGWTIVDQQNQSITAHQAILTKIAGPVGSENLVLTTSVGSRSTHISDAIRDGGTVSVTQFNTSNNNFNPPSHVPGVTANYLWYAIRTCFGDTFTASAAPTDFANLFTVTGNASAALTDVADRSFGGVNNLDPAAFTSGGAGSAVGIVSTLSIQRA